MWLSWALTLRPMGRKEGRLSPYLLLISPHEWCHLFASWYKWDWLEQGAWLICTHMPRDKPRQNSTWQGSENIYLRLVQLSRARKHYSLCMHAHAGVCVCVIVRCECFKSARKSLARGGKKANKCNLHSILFTKQPHTTPDDKINDGARLTVEHSPDSSSADWFEVDADPVVGGAIINISSVLVFALRPAEGL